MSDNIGQLESKKKDDRVTDLTKDEGKKWMKKLVNLKKRTELFLETRRTRSCFCRHFCYPFDNYNAFRLLKNWDELDEEEPSAPVGDRKLQLEKLEKLDEEEPSAPIGDHKLKRQSSAPVIAIDGELNGNGIVVKGDVNINCTNVILVLNSLSVKGENDKFARDLVSMLKMVPEPTGTSSVQSTHDNRLVRNKSFEMKNDEEGRIVHSTTRQF